MLDRRPLTINQLLVVKALTASSAAHIGFHEDCTGMLLAKSSLKNIEGPETKSCNPFQQVDLLRCGRWFKRQPEVINCRSHLRKAGIAVMSIYILARSLIIRTGLKQCSLKFTYLSFESQWSKRAQLMMDSEINAQAVMWLFSY